jgi:hypothetical protein
MFFRKDENDRTLRFFRKSTTPKRMIAIADFQPHQTTRKTQKKHRENTEKTRRNAENTEKKKKRVFSLAHLFETQVLFRRGSTRDRASENSERRTNAHTKQIFIGYWNLLLVIIGCCGGLIIDYN